MSKSIKKIIVSLSIFSMVFCTSNIVGEKTVYALDKKATINTKNLGPVTGRDTVYQIIVDRFYDGDKSNNKISKDNIFDDKDNDGSGDGKDLKLYQGGDFKGIIKKIPYLKKMGVTAVWISAPYENRDSAIEDKQKDGSIDIWSSFHGYHPRNYFATNKHFGTMVDFCELRDELHKNDIKLIIDFVSNHSSRWQNPTDGFKAEDGKLYEPDKKENGEYAFDSNGEPIDYNNDGNIENLLADPNNDEKGFFHGIGDRAGDSSKFGFRHKDLGSLADYSQENPEVINHLEKAALFWKEKGIDGIRHDATLHMNPAFVKGFKDAIDSSKNGPIVQFGEFFIGRPDPKYDEYKSYPDRTGVNNLDFEFYRSINSTFGNFEQNMKQFGEMLLKTSADYKYPNEAITFIDNHDVTRFGAIQESKKVYNAAIAALMTSRGTPNIYYGTEQYIKPEDKSDVAGRVFMEKDCSFDDNSKAFKLISTLSKLRRENDSVAYGTTKILYSNDDVLVQERQFFDKKVVVLINRQPDRDVTINENIKTALPDGEYKDYLENEYFGRNIKVEDGYLNKEKLTVKAGEISVWSCNGDVQGPKIGDVLSNTGRAGNTAIVLGDNLDGDISVKFNDTKAEVINKSKKEVKVKVPEVKAGENEIIVEKNGVKSNGIIYNVLSGDQNQVIFHLKADTKLNENIYIVGNTPELGEWDADKATEAMLNPNYPEWFLPVSVSKGKDIEFKFIKKDSNGNVTWESGNNRILKTSNDSQGVKDTELYTWRN